MSVLYNIDFEVKKNLDNLKRLYLILTRQPFNIPRKLIVVLNDDTENCKSGIVATYINRYSSLYLLLSFVKTNIQHISSFPINPKEIEFESIKRDLINIKETKHCWIYCDMFSVVKDKYRTIPISNRIIRAYDEGLDYVPYGEHGEFLDKPKYRFDRNNIKELLGR